MHRPFFSLLLLRVIKNPIALPVIKEQLLPLQDSSLGEDSNAVVSVNHHNCIDGRNNVSRQVFRKPIIQSANETLTFSVAVGIN